MGNHHSMKQLFQQLIDFSERNRVASKFDEADFSATFDRITPLVQAFPIDFPRFEMLRSRAIALFTDLENIKQMSYPPPHRVKRMGRCNHISQSVLYAASDLPTSFLEVGFTEAEPCALTAQFNLRAGEKLTLLPIGELDHVRRHGRSRLGTPGVTEQIEHLQKSVDAHELLALNFVDAYLADYMSRTPNDCGQRNLYEVTARITNAFMRLPGVDGILYPSVKHQGGINFAISPKAFDSKFEVVRFSVTTPVIHHGYGLFEYFEHEHGTRLIEDGDFIWNRDPRFNARTTIPLSAEL